MAVFISGFGNVLLRNRIAFAVAICYEIVLRIGNQSESSILRAIARDVLAALQPTVSPAGFQRDLDRWTSHWCWRSVGRRDAGVVAVCVQLWLPHHWADYRKQAHGRRTAIVSARIGSLCGDNEARYEAVCTGYVVKYEEVVQVERLVADLRQIRDLIHFGAPLSVEERLQPGQRVRVKNGSFAGYEGEVLRRDQETRLIVSVHFMDHGVSVKLDDCQLEPIGSEFVAE